MGLKRRLSDIEKEEAPAQAPFLQRAIRRRTGLDSSSDSDSDGSSLRGLYEAIFRMRNATRTPRSSETVSRISALLSNVDEVERGELQGRCRQARDLAENFLKGSDNSEREARDVVFLLIVALLHLAKSAPRHASARYAAECEKRCEQLMEMKGGAARLCEADLLNWAEAALLVARSRRDFESYQHAIQRFKVAVTKSPNDTDLRMLSVGVAMNGGVDSAPDAAAKAGIIRGACDLCEAGFGHAMTDGDRGYWLDQWGLCLTKLAVALDDPAERARTFDYGETRFAESIETSSAGADGTIYHWAVLLSMRASTLADAPVDALPHQIRSEEKVRSLLERAPDDTILSNLLGVCLMSRAVLLRKLDRDAVAVITEARRVLSAAHRRERGEATYNLACWAALFSGEDEARRWLELAQSSGVLPRRTHLERDSDLDAVRHTAWFRRILESAPTTDPTDGDSDGSAAPEGELTLGADGGLVDAGLVDASVVGGSVVDSSVL